MLTHSEAALLVVWNAQNNLLSVPVADRAYWPAGSVMISSTIQRASSSTGSSVPVLPVGIAVGAVVLLGLVLLFFLARARKRKTQPKTGSILATSVSWHSI